MLKSRPSRPICCDAQTPQVAESRDRDTNIWLVEREGKSGQACQSEKVGLTSPSKEGVTPTSRLWSCVSLAIAWFRPAASTHASVSASGESLIRPWKEIRWHRLGRLRCCSSSFRLRMAAAEAKVAGETREMMLQLLRAKECQWRHTRAAVPNSCF